MPVDPHLFQSHTEMQRHHCMTRFVVSGKVVVRRDTSQAGWRDFDGPL
jgi:hypothetical protein